MILEMVHDLLATVRTKNIELNAIADGSPFKMKKRVEMVLKSDKIAIFEF